MNVVSLDEVRVRLEGVIDPCSVAAGNAMNIVEMGLIDHLEVLDGCLSVQMRLTSPQCPMLQHFVVEVRRVLEEMPQITDITVRGDRGMDWTPDHMSPAAQHRRRLHLHTMVTRPVPSPVRS